MVDVTQDPTTTDPNAEVSVVIVDDDPLVRTGLSLILGGDQGITVLGQAGDGEEALALVPRLAPDVVLMDIRMPRMDGIAATRQLVAAPRAPRVLVLTTFDADELVVQALQAGAAGFLLKDTPPADLIEAVRTVAAGHPSLSPSVTAQLISVVAGSSPAASEDPVAARARALVETLTEREREVAEAVAAGLSNTEIAEQLYLSIPTVKSHVGRLFTKLGVDNRVQIALVVRDAGER